MITRRAFFRRMPVTATDTQPNPVPRNDAEAQTNAQREQSLRRRADELADHLLNLRRQRTLWRRLRGRMPPLWRSSGPLGLGLGAPNAPSRTTASRHTSTE